MKRILILAVLLVSFGLSSCQCADKPDIGPVEDDEEQAAVQLSPSPDARFSGKSSDRFS